MHMEKKDHVDTHSGILFVIDHGGILARQLYPECGCIVMAGQTNGFAAMAGQINTFAAKAGQMIRFAAMGRVYNTESKKLKRNGVETKKGVRLKEDDIIRATRVVKNAQKKKRHDSEKISSMQADSLSLGDKESKQSSEHHDDTPNEEVSLLTNLFHMLIHKVFGTAVSREFDTTVKGCLAGPESVFRVDWTSLDVYGGGTLARPSRFKTCRMK
ncbi:hypothetical protein Tco_1158929 [Tanacetum coccineum]